MYLKLCLYVRLLVYFSRTLLPTDSVYTHSYTLTMLTRLCSFICMLGFVLNDRLFNVEEIAKANIGTRAVIDDTQQVR